MRVIGNEWPDLRRRTHIIGNILPEAETHCQSLLALALALCPMNCWAFTGCPCMEITSRYPPLRVIPYLLCKVSCVWGKFAWNNCIQSYLWCTHVINWELKKGKLRLAFKYEQLVTRGIPSPNQHEFRFYGDQDLFQKLPLRSSSKVQPSSDCHFAENSSCYKESFRWLCPIWLSPFLANLSLSSTSGGSTSKWK